MRIAAALLALAATGCATPVALESYPWAIVSDECGWSGELVGVDVHSGYFPPLPPQVTALGYVRTTDGRPLGKDEWVEVWFANRWGAMGAMGTGAQFVDGRFTVCVDADMVRAKGGSSTFTATLSASRGGPILYQTPRPQRFEPDKPIVVLIAPVAH